MASTQQLNFLQEKIQEIGSAIFFNQSESVLKLPTTVVSTLTVDDFGYVWFFVQKPKQQLKEFENDFPVRLDFFKKGAPCFLQVSGKGWVVSDPEEMNGLDILPDDARQMAMNEMVLVKVKIMKADYYESRTRTRNSWWQNAVHMFNSMIGHSSHMRTNTYYPAS